MLKSLTVWNFALLEHVQVEFQPGLNILTGETGAGKSILIDSLGAVLGARMSADMVRSGCDWLRVEAVFSLEDESLGLHELLTQQAIDDSDKELIITRQLTRAGRSTALVNGCHVTLAVLRQIGAYLVDIHGQNENLALLKEENQFHLLDGYDPDVAEALAANGIVFGLIGIELGLLTPALFQALPERIFGIMANDTLLAVPFFTLIDRKSVV